MDRTRAMILISLTTVLVAACIGGTSSPSAPQIALPGTTWIVTSIGGKATDATAPPTMTFGADGTVNGTTGCNGYNGAYTVDGGSITFGPMASTLMLCAGPIGVQETAFTAALSKATAWSVAADGSLTLSGAADIVATPAPTS